MAITRSENSKKELILITIWNIQVFHHAKTQIGYIKEIILKLGKHFHLLISQCFPDLWPQNHNQTNTDLSVWILLTCMNLFISWSAKVHNLLCIHALERLMVTSSCHLTDKLVDCCRVSKNPIHICISVLGTQPPITTALGGQNITMITRCFKCLDHVLN